MRILWLLMILVFNFHSGSDYLVIKKKVIIVSGNTSLGKFDCTYDVAGLKDTLSFIDNKSRDVFLFDIAVADFGCGNFLLNNDFRKTIRAKEFPKAYVKIANLRKKKDNYSCDLHLEIAGQKLLFKEFELSNKDEKLMGHLILDFGTLELDPPKKWGGLIKVEETLSLSFSLAYINIR